MPMSTASKAKRARAPAKPVEILRATVEGQVVELSGDEMAATFGKALAVVAEWRQVRMIGTRGDEAEGDAGAG